MEAGRRGSAHRGGRSNFRAGIRAGSLLVFARRGRRKDICFTRAHSRNRWAGLYGKRIRGGVAVGGLECPWEVLDEQGEVPAERAGIHPGTRQRRSERGGGRPDECQGRRDERGNRTGSLSASGSSSSEDKHSDRKCTQTASKPRLHTARHTPPSLPAASPLPPPSPRPCTDAEAMRRKMRPHRGAAGHAGKQSRHPVCTRRLT